MHFLTPVLRDYAWGTSRDIPDLLGIRPTGEPVAEAWWGAHTSAPSRVHSHDGPLPLSSLVAREPVACLGADAVARWGARLPFLLKVLAIDKPLSIQVHPTLEQARAGFEREQRGTGGAAHHFLDPFHKPEMVVAISPMTVLVGVRQIAALRDDLTAIATEGAAVLSATLDSGDLHHFIPAALAGAADSRTLSRLAEVGAGAPPGTSLGAAAAALRSFPGDPGAMIALAMNVVELEPGQAIFTDAGVLHSYQSGMGLEIMANSDNVVRAGLTHKPVDVPLLLDLADTQPTLPARPERREGEGRVDLTTSAEEFALTLVTASATVPAGSRIVLAVRGGATITAGAATMTLAPGQAAFVPHAQGDAEIVSTGMCAVARVP
ncbi:mannose-6-phosphate isomerase, class I [Demequina sp. NBRC 110053]|uniref:mannose-6-phosphate isomerase, class I n=1 Tax=Demequina sp. NBRC 110053 TaxID=1570342 RepID=UPI0009FC13EB|nr:mannose-6-phosphate isomerase, class I [Demequina sp. NBRC 110053]